MSTLLAVVKRPFPASGVLRETTRSATFGTVCSSGTIGTVCSSGTFGTFGTVATFGAFGAVGTVGTLTPPREPPLQASASGSAAASIAHIAAMVRAIETAETAETGSPPLFPRTSIQKRRSCRLRFPGRKRGRKRLVTFPSLSRRRKA